jgi:hypothetical protein
MVHGKAEDGRFCAMLDAFWPRAYKQKRGAAQRAGAHDAGEIAFHERDAGTLNGDISAGAHGDADIGRGQSGRSRPYPRSRPVSSLFFSVRCLTLSVWGSGGRRETTK